MGKSVGLFETGREANVQSAIAMVEDVLIELGHFVNDCRFEVKGALRAWNVHKGSARATVTLEKREQDTHLRAVGTVMTLSPEVDRLALFRRLLCLNGNTLFGAYFALSGDHVVVVSERTTLDLDRSEVHDLIQRVRGYADEWDDRLVVEFGGSLGLAEDELGDDDFIEI